ncbi:MAG: hypothetical protein NZ840_05570 [Anaerolineales bacterium]|nr:hypothetical protein [Anaerolineales bacterium]MDW8161506.1 hypothetical protein [Anaerolineales bacterium]
MRLIALRSPAILIGLLLLAACANGIRTAPVVPTPSPPATLTVEATVTPSPLPPTLLLVAPRGEASPWFAEVSPILEEIARQKGFLFEVKPSITSQEIQSRSIPLAVILPAEAEPESLAKAAPQTQFLAIDYPSLTPQPNLSLISAQPYRADWEGFVAGFIAAAVTEDWRVAVVSDPTTAEGKAAQNAFRNGVRYLCGLCQPLYPPFPVPTYPLYGQLSKTSTATDVEAVMEYFKTWSVKTVYLHRPAPEWLAAFGQAGFNLISDQPPPPDLKERWVVSIQSIDLASEIRALIPLLLEGKGGQSISLSLTLAHANEALFSPGRQAFTEQMIGELVSGYIDSGVDPISGELRQ